MVHRRKRAGLHLFDVSFAGKRARLGGIWCRWYNRRYEKSGTPFPVEGEGGVHIYRVLQEAVNNVARHSGAKQAWVRLRFLPEFGALHEELWNELKDEVVKGTEA